MPEGPSIFIVKETIGPLFKGKRITAASGNAKIEMGKLAGKKISDIKSWGKHLLICLPGLMIRIHFLMFGSYSMDTQTKQDRSVRLVLSAGKRKLYFYTCSVKLLEGELESLYDWEADLLSKKWNPAKARKKLKAIPKTMVCDAILDQDIFAGAGNIFKNEVLYRVRIHPETRIQNIPPRKLTELVTETHRYAYDFLKWKKAFTLKKHWLAHTKKTCLRCDLPFIKKYCGKTKRRSFFCTNCQEKYGS
ncbi:MAG TPA: DNA-formamidopyrimidine glycosylase family protein [Chitinophagaceae bacterium]|jgi:endonuclease-8|nr:DNA-formamidopyrimidine glycosylase family protein [Chitinophagaceae bacterium]